MEPLFFNKRKYIAEQFEKFAEENNVLNCPLNCITWLVGLDLIDTRKANELMEKNGFDGKLKPVREEND